MHMCDRSLSLLRFLKNFGKSSSGWLGIRTVEKLPPDVQKERMPTYEPPLTGFEVFRANSGSQLGAAVEGMGASVLSLVPTSELSAFANSVHLPNGELWFCSYGTPVRLAFRECDYVRLQLPISGSGCTKFGGHVVDVAGNQCCVSSAAAVIDFGAGFQQIAWRVRGDSLIRKLNARLNRPITRPIEFQPTLRLESPLQQALARTLRCILDVLAAGNEPTSLIVAELEQALLGGLLFAADHNLRTALEELPARASPVQVRRAEEFVAANWDQPLSVDEIAGAVGVSVRTLYRSFRIHRGYTPMEFLKQCRLGHARRLLGEPDSKHNVTTVAMACGFGDLSHFSKDFLRAFGELPSTVIRRRTFR